MAEADSSNYIAFRDCFSAALLQRISTTKASKEPKRRSARSRKKLSAEDDTASQPLEGKDAEDLADFIEVR